MLHVRRPVAASAAAAALVATLACADGATAATSPRDRLRTVTGELVTVVDGPAKERRVRLADGSFVPVTLAGRTAPGSTVSVTVTESELSGRPAVTRRSGATAVGSGSTATVLAAPVLGRAVTPGAHQVTLVPVIPKGVRGTVTTATQARAQLAGASRYWSEQSGGVVSFVAASVTAPLALAASCSDPFALWKEAASRTGFVAGANRHLVLLLPPGAGAYGCQYGLASISAGVNAGGYAYVSDTTWPVLAHELGHNLGLAHAKRLVCPTSADAALTATATTAVGGSCSIRDYGDPWDVMAASAPNNVGSLSAPQAYRIGLLAGSAVQEVTAGTVSTVLGSVSGRVGLRAVRVVDPVTKVAYFVEYRERTGRDLLLYSAMVAGVRVLREGDSAGGAARASLALDATPTGVSTDFAWGVPVGGTFRSYGGGVTVKVVSAGNGTARLSVTAGRATAGPAAVPPTGRVVDLTLATGTGAPRGSWRPAADSRYALSTALTTVTSGATWSVTVDGGRTFDLVGTAFPAGARGRILVDGRAAADFDSYRAVTSTPYQQVLGSVAVPAGRHTITVVALPAGDRRTLALDAFRLR